GLGDLEGVRYIIRRQVAAVASLRCGDGTQAQTSEGYYVTTYGTSAACGVAYSQARRCSCIEGQWRVSKALVGDLGEGDGLRSAGNGESLAYRWCCVVVGIAGLVCSNGTGTTSGDGNGVTAYGTSASGGETYWQARAGGCRDGKWCITIDLIW